MHFLTSELYDNSEIEEMISNLSHASSSTVDTYGYHKVSSAI